MAQLFVDTSGWGCWLVRVERFHQQARQLVRDAVNRGDVLVTSNFVLAELTGLLTSPLRRSKLEQIELLTDLRSDSAVEVVPVGTATEDEAWKLWEQRIDKEFTLVDCTSFIIMRERGIQEALTADRHFEQEGFVRLLK